MSDLALRFGLAFDDLYARDGLVRIDGLFLDALGEADAGLRDRLLAARGEPDALGRKGEGDLLLAVAPHVDDFLAKLFAIEGEVAALRGAHHALAPLYAVKRLFVQRRAVKGTAADGAATADGDALAASLRVLGADPADEVGFARVVEGWLADEAAHGDDLALAARYAAWAVLTPAGKERHHAGILFKVPHRIDPQHLVPTETIEVDGVRMLRFPPDRRRQREGFALTDPGLGLAGALDHANYCIWCQHQGKDSCSTGLRDRKTGDFQRTVFGVPLNGCPLDEKISEMNEAKAGGNPLAALAVIAVDNPLCAATGHRICNDCMKACIYQKQEPVDIPQVETRALKDVLALPWGFEIYGLLTRWNPLDIRRPLPRPDSGRTVLVVGLGPAGFNLSHHLMNDGHRVVAIDGLKIEPLAPEVCGVDGARRVPFRPIHDVESLRENLGERVMAGFGGVAEYGITVRWDKNFLKMVRLLLERRRQFAMFGGVRFGGTITPGDAFAMGFDHVALCAGAGRPTIVEMENGLARGVRAASDFLMALQLTGAAKADSVASLQLRLPVVVIGGGLTAIDTATEALAYYVVQVEKFRRRYEALAAARGEGRVRAAWSAEEATIADEFLAHASAIAAEREAAAAEGRTPDLVSLLDGWGGATIAYRRRLVDAPSYTLNHEEVAKAMEEGIRFAEGLSPVAVDLDGYGHAAGLTCERRDADGNVERVRLAARAVLMAAGTQPNTVLARESDGAIELEGKHFRAYGEDGAPVTPERSAKPAKAEVLMHRNGDGRWMSFWGDLHPSFAGNVVKAMGGTKQGYPVISRLLAERAPAADADALLGLVGETLRPTVADVIRLTPNIVDVVVRASAAARAFRPGQFYRLQNFETLAPRTDGTTLGMEGLALTGAWVDREKGLLSTIVLEMGGSSDLCALLRPGEPVVLMGPTGTPTTTPAGETVLLAGGGLGNAVLFSIGQALRAAGSRVVYFAGYKRMIDRYHVAEIERAADVVVWGCDEAPGFTPGRPQDRTFVGNIVAAIDAYGRGALGTGGPPLSAVDRMIVIGSDRMMAAVGRARHGVLSDLLKPEHVAIASINSPMQCMMKEICAQCLQPHVDPATGKRSVVFSCFDQDQQLDHVDFAALGQRLGQNGTHEKLTAQWIDRCLRQLSLRTDAA